MAAFEMVKLTALTVAICAAVALSCTQGQTMAQPNPAEMSVEATATS